MNKFEYFSPNTARKTHYVFILREVVMLTYCPPCELKALCGLSFENTMSVDFKQETLLKSRGRNRNRSHEHIIYLVSCELAA